MKQAIKQILDNQILIMQILKGIHNDKITELTKTIEKAQNAQKYRTLVASEDEVVKLRCMSYNEDLQRNINVSSIISNSIQE